MSFESQMLNLKPLNLTACVFHSADLWDGWYQFTLQIPELAAQDQRNQGSPCCSLSRAIQTNVEEWRHAKVGLPSEWPSLCSFSTLFGNQLLACVDLVVCMEKFCTAFHLSLFICIFWIAQPSTPINISKLGLRAQSIASACIWATKDVISLDSLDLTDWNNYNFRGSQWLLVFIWSE